MRKIKEKLSSQKGESLSETLIGVLISAIALLLLASMITAGTRIVRKSMTNMNNFYTDVSGIESEDADFVVSGTNKLKITMNNVEKTPVTNESSGVDVKIYKGENTELKAYKPN